MPALLGVRRRRPLALHRRPAQRCRRTRSRKSGRLTSKSRPNGKFLYSTERTTSKIALFTLAPGTGRLAYVASFATEAQPRGIGIDPSGQYLVASGEKSDHLSYKVDQSTGKLGEAHRYPVRNGANWVEIIDVQ
ncbi:beta-propeller fold lactonase family protein [Bradyrhizobium sp. Leo121]|uniref:beta-propeller fold lactonase family protein n=1 Tax=Bradyrhizobium sp. Leo121 TaxID=1571195 RepID=UPI001FDF5D7A|nr:beta-propeller fold lactonase family protein [Bradyrhizobium sp. Leo121]